mmetsp:Transcript_76478/g.211679  ORF Transcript_76478/g.211679 Transcript_76478/m.211679 type:complete len:245 (-) Transcript_76478:267-1001(-)
MQGAARATAPRLAYQTVSGAAPNRSWATAPRASSRRPPAAALSAPATCGRPSASAAAGGSPHEYTAPGSPAGSPGSARRPPSPRCRGPLRTTRTPRRRRRARNKARRRRASAQSLRWARRPSGTRLCSSLRSPPRPATTGLRSGGRPDVRLGARQGPAPRSLTTYSSPSCSGTRRSNRRLTTCNRRCTTRRHGPAGNLHMSATSARHKSLPARARTGHRGTEAYRPCRPSSSASSPADCRRGSR